MPLNAYLKDFSKYTLISAVLLSILLRWCVSLYPYSGQNRPPMYGDYEAQRHWQEITLHIPIEQWYHNTTQNDLQYWGLDYPPLTAYHSYVIGYLAEIIDPESVVLFASRGYENAYHKLFMRWTVFISDIYFYIPAIIGFYFVNYKLRIKEMRLHKLTTIDKNVFFLPGIASCVTLLYPGLILIDYGHFQYNCVSLGLFVWAALFILLDKCVLATLFFVLAVNYKQMELYHSLPFFLYLLRKCIPFNHKKYIYSLWFFIKISCTVLVLFFIIWFPFLTDLNSVKQVLIRVFPLARGVFEDKVANVWCFINVFIKLKMVFDNATMAKVCLVMTFIAILPSSVDLFFRPNIHKFVLAVINSSLSFFLFSFQVHEKTILLCAIPVLLYFPRDPIPCLWFLMTTNFSMLPLFSKDGLLLSYFSLCTIYFIVFGMLLMTIDKNVRFSDIFNIIKINNLLKGTKKEYNGLFYKIFNIMYVSSLVIMVSLTICLVFVVPPKRYPDLFPLLIALFSCITFMLFYIYFNYCQFIVPSKYYIIVKKPL